MQVKIPPFSHTENIASPLVFKGVTLKCGIMHRNSGPVVPKKVLIIGAGISGMSAGCYLQMNGYATEILEANPMAGGLCTAWKRKGFTFDPCTHWLVGTAPSNVFYPIWQELGVLRDAVVHNHNKFKTVTSIHGVEFSIYSDIDELEEEMLKIGPEDKKVIHRYCNGIRDAKKINLPVYKAREVYNLIDYLKFPFKNWRLLRFLLMWKPLRIDTFGENFKNAELKDLFLNFFTDHEDFSMVPQLLTISWYSNEEAGRPEGGSLTINGNMQKRYEELGGKIHFRSPVEEILTENGTAVGVKLVNGDTHMSDVVLSTADLHFTMNTLLKSGNKEVFHNYFKKFTPFPSFVDVNLGINIELDEDLAHSINYYIDDPVTIGNGHTSNKIVSHLFSFDETAAPKGKSVIMTHVRSHDYEYWLDLYENNRELYTFEKKRIADEIIEVVEKQFGTETMKIRENIEVIDVSTPVSYKRWTNNHRGSYEGWIPCPKSVGNSLKKKVKGVDNFYLAGHWIEPGGGIPAAALSGRNVAQIICKSDQKKFVTEKV